MVRTSTKDIEITVEARYWEQNSIPAENHYFFIYFITIANKSGMTVQLLRRHWNIVDGTGEKREVDGEGVVGETPVLAPGEKFEYNSGCNLTSEIGVMQGYYVMRHLADGIEFKVEIPRFQLIVPAKLN